MPPEQLAIFPLSNVVLFPRVLLPLHLFEPRYVQMAEHVLATSRRIGMVCVPPEHVDDMAGDPPLHPIGCAGAITQARQLPDGRYNIVLLGTQRFRIADEPPRPRSRLYRVATVEPLDDPFDPAESERVERLRSRLIDLVRELVRVTDPGRAASVAPELFGGVDDESFVNTLSNAVGLPVSDKQALLEAPSIPARYDRLEGLLSFHLSALRSPGAPNSGAIH